MPDVQRVRDDDRPAIHLIDRECDALYALALDAGARQSGQAALLLAELDRAEVHRLDALPPDIVTMHSRVEFVDEGSGATRTITLVYPGEADIAAGKVSVFTPIGAGLIGMRAGQTILWPDRDGASHRLRVVKVDRP
ncbi:nucleoside diphosphate kinase regulator [Sphingomonas sp. HF-S3]|uniref:Nucleoside diphosphate kinase regulator n=1 Tax=Sphingomonas rustica TaxID=3103142 RepID=A0ABV0B9M8_9SPHN